MIAGKFPAIIKVFLTVCFRPLKGGSLLYALFIMLLVSVICSSVLMFKYYSTCAVRDVGLQEKVFRDVYSGITLMLANPDIVPCCDETPFQLFSDKPEVMLHKKEWGVFDILSCWSLNDKFPFSKTALVGDYLPEDERVSVFLCDKGSGLNICGQTRIAGLAYLPKAGVRWSYIEGKSYMGKKLVYGPVKQSPKLFPGLNEKITKLPQNLMNNCGSQPEEVSVLLQDTLYNPFNEPAITIHSKNAVFLNNIFVKGNIIIVSDKYIEIEKSAEIEDVICFAPSIKLGKGFSGSLQMIASDSILIEEKCGLKYPSAAVICNLSDGNSISLLSLGKDVSFSGLVCLYKKHKQKNNPALIQISPGCKITGQVVCNDLVEHKGTVHGSVYCDKFILRTASSFYENQLLDAVIDATELPDEFVGINCFSTGNFGKNIIKWLY